MGYRRRGRTIGLAATIVVLAAAGAATARATAPATPADRYPTIGGGYVPTDADERGLWMQLDVLEREMQTSDFLVRDPALNGYVRGVLCRTVGQAACASLRLYIVRHADFNASMAPNGMVTVNTGALLRLRSEAQLAAVLGHEFTHFARRHTLQRVRDTRKKAGVMASLSTIPAAGYGSALAVRLLRLITIGSLYGFSREMEREADAGSIPLMAAAGYDPAVAAPICQALTSEEGAAAAARRRKAKPRTDTFYATHPSPPERIAALTALARPYAGRSFASDGAAAYRAAMRAWWPQLIDDQIKLNDFGGSDWLLHELAVDGWTPALLYARGELYRARGRPADLTQAASFYRAALAGDAPVEAWRGLGLVTLRGGDAAAGRRALRTYLARKPDASDRAMIAMLAAEPP